MYQASTNKKTTLARSDDQQSTAVDKDLTGMDTLIRVGSDWVRLATNPIMSVVDKI